MGKSIKSANQVKNTKPLKATKPSVYSEVKIQLTYTTKIWLCYDLGVRGEYTSFYAWLDRYNALECADNVAIIKEYKYKGDLIEYLKADLNEHVNFNKSDRIYLICTNPIFARFIIGGRKRAIWVGYSSDSSNDTDI